MQGYRETLLESATDKTCVGCVATEGLYVHHKDKDRHNGNVTNLEYRCPSCHRKIHPTTFNRTIKKWKKPVGDIYELRTNVQWGIPHLQCSFIQK